MKGTSRRRRVIQAAEAAAGVAAGVAIVSKGLAQIANEAVGVAVMGLQERGQSHIDAFLGINQVRVVALVDPDKGLFDAAAKKVADKQGSAPKYYEDIRGCLKDTNVNAVSVAAPGHWRALAAILACQAGKDVYVEAPCSWSVREGRKMVEAAEKYKRIVQVGLQSRSDPKVRDAVARLRAGEIGKLYMVRGLCYQKPASVSTQDKPDPAGVNWDLWLGPATQDRGHTNKDVYYNWPYFWAFGAGEIGYQGVHQIDVGRWALGKGLPVEVRSVGGRFGIQDPGETPNTQLSTFEFDDGTLLVSEVRGLPSNDELGVKVGNLFYGQDGGASGYMGSNDYKAQGKPKKDVALAPVGGKGEANHFENFINCVRSRKREDLDADILEGHLSAALCHIANISYRLGRRLVFDPKTESFPGDDEANKLLARQYRAPFAVPDQV